MKKKLSKKETQEHINEFFFHIKEKSPEEVKKIKKLAMSYNIKLGDKRKLFCKKCFEPFIEPSCRIKNDMITLTCDHCEHKNRWKFEHELNLSEETKPKECC
jgi:RNase P subunit RPR2